MVTPRTLIESTIGKLSGRPPTDERPVGEMIIWRHLEWLSVRPLTRNSLDTEGISAQREGIMGIFGDADDGD